MGWTERQQAMLQEMGLRLWLPTPAVLPESAAPSAGPAPADVAPALATAWVPAPPAATAAPVSAQPPAQAPVSAQPPAQAPVSAQPPAQAPALQPRDTSPVATMDWPALRSAVAGCRACGLCESRRQTVFGVGHPQAHCMVVGEAPGEQEDAQGEPFVGAAGQLLDRMLAALGLGRQADPAGPSPARQVFIANTLKCRPPRNRNPAPQELAACQPFLERQVALVQPRVILAMGRFAVQLLLGSDAPIGKLRGTVHQWRGVPLVVTYHPAYLLRQPADKAKAWDDLCLAAGVMGPPGSG